MIFYVYHTNINIQKSYMSEITNNALKSALLTSDYINIFQNNMLPMLVINYNTLQILEVNKAALDFYGYDELSFKKMKINDINILPEAYVKFQMSNVVDKSKFKFKFKHRLADGLIKDVEVFSTKIEVKGEDILFSIVNDISNSAIQANIINSYNMIIDNADEVAFIKDTSYRIINCNQSFLRMIGAKSKDDVLGKTYQELLSIEQNDLCEKLHKDDENCLCLDNGEMIIRYEEYKLNDGINHQYFVKKFPIYDDGKINHLAVVMSDRTDKFVQEKENIERSERIHKHKSALVTLMQTNSIFANNPERNYSSITRICSRAMDVERVSIWFFDELKTKLVCYDIYDKSGKVHKSGFEILYKYYPIYFEALTFNLTFSIENVYEDYRTSEFVDNYMKPNNIYSMLDAPIRIANEIIGVVCFEHTDSIRKWFEDEELFATTIADYVAQNKTLSLVRKLQEEVNNLKQNLQIR